MLNEVKYNVKSHKYKLLHSHTKKMRVRESGRHSTDTTEISRNKSKRNPDVFTANEIKSYTPSDKERKRNLSICFDRKTFLPCRKQWWPKREKWKIQDTNNAACMIRWICCSSRAALSIPEEKNKQMAL